MGHLFLAHTGTLQSTMGVAPQIVKSGSTTDEFASLAFFFKSNNHLYWVANLFLIINRSRRPISPFLRRVQACLSLHTKCCLVAMDGMEAGTDTYSSINPLHSLRVLGGEREGQVDRRLEGKGRWPVSHRSCSRSSHCWHCSAQTFRGILAWVSSQV